MLFDTAWLAQFPKTFGSRSIFLRLEPMPLSKEIAVATGLVPRRYRPFFVIQVFV
jgi:hypothetical protein